MTSFNEWVGVIASWASILGFLVSVYVLWEVRQIRKQFLLRIRINDLLNALKEQAAEMNRKLNDFEEPRGDILGVFIRCESTLSNFLPKLSRDEKRSTKHLVKLLRSYHRSSFLTKKRNLDREAAWQMYTELQGIIESIGLLWEDIRSGR